MGESTGPAVMVLGALPSLVAAGTLGWAVACRRAAARQRLGRLARPTAVCAVLSLTTSFALPQAGSGWKLVEAALLLLLVAVVTRWSPLRELAAALPAAALAVTLWPLPLVTGESFLESIGIGAFWLLPVVGAVAVGAYPRRQELRRRRAVAEARSAQRLQLSRDLHDFVAHDISGIVVQAQAARFVAATDPSHAVLALERIEKAGLSALAAMDRTVRMLHGPEAAATEPLPGLSRLLFLVDDFTAAGATEAYLDLPPTATEALSREAGSAAYRIVVEALTNIRRHAPGASRATVVFTTPTAATVEIEVTNDRGAGEASARRGSRGGLGIPALTEHAQALGGTLSAGPHGDGGWRLSAVLPADVPADVPGVRPVALPEDQPVALPKEKTP
ncbi:histidine kinase [Streptomyces sp. ME02-6979.5a]|uniref:sensor histidine kinase n=1 Tax=Streptomyces sp. ME02-6979.5a TaxID=462925 RepID=UPI0029A341C0|nr:histidine kinase [Streptomyces sp. ME02-6979.5a]MDX3342128.1 histidine kinase [Streptomyces sp. ME02-6979.5a]